MREWAHILLKQAGYTDPRTLDNATIAAGIHDIGNLVGRTMHEVYSAQMAPVILPGLLEDPDRWNEICAGVIHHNEGHYKLRGYTNQPFNVRQEILAAQNTPLSNAILISDKLHIGPDRVSWNSRNPESISNHPHSEGNLNTQTREAGLSRDGKEFVWKLQCRTEFEGKEAKHFPEAVILNGNGSYIPCASDRVRVDPNDPNSPIDPSKACRQIIYIYGPHTPGEISRIGLIIDNVFQLCSVEDMLFEYVNAQGKAIFERKFTPETTDEILEEFAMMNASKV